MWSKRFSHSLADNQAVREQLALSIRYDKGFEFVRKQFMEASTPASAFAFLAVVIKDWGGTPCCFKI